MRTSLTSVLLLAVLSTPSIAGDEGCDSTVELLSAQLKDARAQIAQLVTEAQRTAKRLDAVEDILQRQRETPTASQTGRENRRRAQRTGSGDDAAVVHIVTRATTTLNCPSHVHAAPFDVRLCADPAYDHCHREECADGHRRAQTAESSCTAEELQRQSKAVHLECCDEPGEDCSSGAPSTCNSDCAAVFLPFWTACEASLGVDAAATFAPTVTRCREAVGESLAVQLGVTCDDGSVDNECIPECTVDLHGFLLLLNVDGDDSKMSCELHHGEYSWVGAASDGGYLGSDAELLFSAIVSGAAGVYVGKILNDAGISTDITIRPGQVVRIAGDAALSQPPRWGSCSGEDTCAPSSPTEEVGNMHYASANDGVCSDGSAGSCTAYCALGTDSTDCGGRTCTAGSVAVQERGHLSLTRLNLDGMASLTAAPGAELTIRSIALSTTLILSAVVGLSTDVASTNSIGRLHLVEVLLKERTDRPSLTGTIEVNLDGRRTFEPPDLLDLSLGTPSFQSTGQCEVTEGGRCVGRAGGYEPDEDCVITVVGGMGALEPCSVFDVFDSTGSDALMLDRVRFDAANCPVGTVLAPGDEVTWHSSGALQGQPPDVRFGLEGCEAAGLCGPLGFDGGTGIGGGWQICFPPAPPLTVVSGPCTLSHNSLCVGRPDGYLPNERCEVRIGYTNGDESRLGPCGVFDMELAFCTGYDFRGFHDKITFVDVVTGAREDYGGAMCPEHRAVHPGDLILWSSTPNRQGNAGQPAVYMNNDCQVLGLCGPQGAQEATLGGGWRVCFDGALRDDSERPTAQPRSFVVVSGPCTVSDRGVGPASCVGRAEGRLVAEEQCVVIAGRGRYGDCPVFSVEQSDDYRFKVALNRDVSFGNVADCPVGVEVFDNDMIFWSIEPNVDTTTVVGWQLCFEG